MKYINEFTLDDKTYKVEPGENGCVGCVGEFSGTVCDDITNYVAERTIKDCVCNKVIYINDRLEKERGNE